MRLRKTGNQSVFSPPLQRQTNARCLHSTSTPPVRLPSSHVARAISRLLAFDESTAGPHERARSTSTTGNSAVASMKSFMAQTQSVIRHIDADGAATPRDAPAACCDQEEEDGLLEAAGSTSRARQKPTARTPVYKLVIYPRLRVAEQGSSRPRTRTKFTTNSYRDQVSREIDGDYCAGRG